MLLYSSEIRTRENLWTSKPLSRLGKEPDEDVSCNTRKLMAPEYRTKAMWDTLSPSRKYLTKSLYSARQTCDRPCFSHRWRSISYFNLVVVRGSIEPHILSIICASATVTNLRTVAVLARRQMRLHRHRRRRFAVHCLSAAVGRPDNGRRLGSTIVYHPVEILSINYPSVPSSAYPPACIVAIAHLDGHSSGPAVAIECTLPARRVYASPSRLVPSSAESLIPFACSSARLDRQI